MSMKIIGVASAFIKNNDKYLFMKRAENRTKYAGFWSIVGGGVREEEMGFPETAVLREIEEETGIRKDRISGLKLRYVCVSQAEEQIILHNVFSCETDEAELISTDEGETFWIPEDEALKKGYTNVMLRLVTHYFAQAIHNDTIYLFNEKSDTITPL